jgi:alpha-beta hydrolase superfamily lysophospholipase
LHPGKTIAVENGGRPHETLWFDGDGVRLHGWWFKAAEPRRGTVVYLHGIGSNRGASLSVADHFVPRGFDVVSFDARAHGDSDGEACTYGYYEKKDVSRVLDRIVGPRPIVLLGHSLGAAIALQTAAEDRRVAAVIAVSTFSDLRTVASERAPFFASQGNIDNAFRLAETQAKFRVDEVSAVTAAAKITVPVFVIHGQADDETPPAHSQRVFAALHQPKDLLLIPGAKHDDCFNAGSWAAIDAWVDKVFTSPRT